METIEIWKQIEGHEHHAVSNLGRIKTLDRCVNNILYKSRILAQHVNHKGYAILSFQKKAYTVHKLVAMAFAPGWFEGAEIDHLDCNKLNNRADNLEWVTHAENMRRASLNKRMRSGNNVKIINTETGEVFNTIGEAAMLHKVNRSTMSRYVHGLRTNYSPFQLYDISIHTAA